MNGLPADEKLRRYLARGLAWPEEDFETRMEALQAVEFFPSAARIDMLNRGLT